MSNLPQALQRQLDEAEALEQQIYGQKEPAPEADPTPEVESVEPEAVAPSEPEAQEQVAPEAPTQPQPTSREEDANYWKQRFATVQGMLNAQSGQFRDLQAQVQALTTELSEAKKTKVEPSKEEPLVTEKDVEAFGSDLINLQERVAKKAIAEAKEQFQDIINHQSEYIRQLESRLGNVDQQVAASAQDRFYTALGQQVPDWEAVNGDQRFLNWLSEVDSLTGVARQVYLDDAANRLDLARTAAIFQAFKATLPKVDAPQGQSRQAELQRQVAPSKGRGTSAPEFGKKVWTKEEYERAYDPRNIRSMGQAAADALEREADLAAQEGRVQW